MYVHSFILYYWFFCSWETNWGIHTVLHVCVKNEGKCTTLLFFKALLQLYVHSFEQYNNKINQFFVNPVTWSFRKHIWRLALFWPTDNRDPPTRSVRRRAEKDLGRKKWQPMLHFYSISKRDRHLWASLSFVARRNRWYFSKQVNSRKNRIFSNCHRC
jgi:hypothetical protein